MTDLLKIKLNTEDITARRKEISRLLILESENIKSGAINKLSTDDIKLLFQLYDQHFFDNWFKDSFKGRMKFSLSKRMTRSAGLTLCPKNIDRIKPEDLVIEIRIGVDFFFHYDMLDGSKAVCGIRTGNSLEALQLVFEHELCHVLEFIHFKRSSCSGDRFRAIANNLFGHTESYHRLPTYKQIAGQKLGLKPGDTVSFVFEGNRHSGILYRINKRATVMVPDKNGPMADRQGNRYSKYYVPLNLLQGK